MEPPSTSRGISLIQSTPREILCLLLQSSLEQPSRQSSLTPATDNIVSATSDRTRDMKLE